MAKIGKRTTKARDGVDRDKAYSLEEAVKMVKERAKAKFDETVEVSMNLGVDPKHADQMVRGMVNLPNGTGRSLRVGVFARGAKADEAKAAGAGAQFMEPEFSHHGLVNRHSHEDHLGAVPGQADDLLPLLQRETPKPLQVPGDARRAQACRFDSGVAAQKCALRFCGGPTKLGA